MTNEWNEKQTELGDLWKGASESESEYQSLIMYESEENLGMAAEQAEALLTAIAVGKTLISKARRSQSFSLTSSSEPSQ